MAHLLSEKYHTHALCAELILVLSRLRGARANSWGHHHLTQEKNLIAAAQKHYVVFYWQALPSEQEYLGADSQTQEVLSLSSSKDTCHLFVTVITN